MQPPADFPRDVWKALVRQGKLKDGGGGFYRLPETQEPPGGP